jgi:hypothetical protein
VRAARGLRARRGAEQAVMPSSSRAAAASGAPGAPKELASASARPPEGDTDGPRLPSEVVPFNLARFAAVVCAVLLADGAAVSWQWSDGGGSAADPALSRAARSLGLRLNEADVSRGGSGLLLSTRVASLLLTSLLSVNLVVSSDYPLVASNYGFLLHVRGWRRFTSFTCWCWALLTGYFWWAAALSAHAWQSGAPARSAWLPVLFEVCLVTAVLVTLVVHFVLVPVARRKDKYRLKRLLDWRALTLHYANVAMMLVEAVIGGGRVSPSHWLFALAYCNLYLVFAWGWGYSTGVFYYFFLDFSKFRWAPVAYVGLFLALKALWHACVLLPAAVDAWAAPRAREPS